MKKVKVVLSALVITTAVCGAFASNLFAVNSYIKKTADGTPVSTDCTLIGQCANAGEFICQGRPAAGQQAQNLFKLNAAGTACTEVVFHTSETPIN